MNPLDDCFAKGLLKKTPKNITLAKEDLKQAEFFLNEAEDLLKLKKKEMACLALYNAVFHAARALLFKDGIKERSHYCLQKYIEEEYGKSSQFSAEQIALFDILRGLRQEIQYGVSKVKFEENLAELFDQAEKFIEKSKSLVG
ncbi:MAG: HEPN domain-containing protein [Candidatus Micrarchaeota archaeon]